MIFFSRPFLFLTPVFCLGIFLGATTTILITISGLLIGFSILYLFLKSNNFFGRIVPSILIVLAFLLLGNLTISFVNNELVSVNQLSPDRKFTVLVKVLEVDHRDVLESKILCETISFVGKTTLIPHKEKVIIYSYGKIVKPNDVLLIRTSFSPIKNKGNPGEFDVETYWLLRMFLVEAMSMTIRLCIYVLNLLRIFP